MLKEYVEWLKSKNKSELTIKAYTRNIENWFISNNIMAIEHIKGFKAIDLSMYLNTINCSSATKAQIVNSIRSYYSYLVYAKLLTDRNNISKELEIPAIKNQKVEYLTKEEAENFLNIIRNTNNRLKIRNYAIALGFLGTGLREAELVNLKN